MTSSSSSFEAETASPPKIVILCDDGDDDVASFSGTRTAGGKAVPSPPSPPLPPPLPSRIVDALGSMFGLVDVTIRPTSVPIDRFLSLVREDAAASVAADGKGRSVVYAVLLTSSSFSRNATVDALANIIEQESPSPIVYVSIGDRSVDRVEKEDASVSTVAIDCALRIARACSPSCCAIRRRIASHLTRRRQSMLVRDAQVRTGSASYARRIDAAHDSSALVTGDGVDLAFFWRDSVPNHDDTAADAAAAAATAEAPASSTISTPPVRMRGKVRDRYDLGDRLALVTTDRQSGFDRMLAVVPYKGAVLNLISQFWFEHTAHIVPNHLLSVPHPNVCIVRKCVPFPIEFVVRAYMTGSTSTSIWKNYQNGVRTYCGHSLPEGMTKNQKLDRVLLTPTTKEEEHDRPISREEIIREGWMSAQDFQVAADAALAVFAYGQELAFNRGLILVDTKYEFGKDIKDGTIRLIDEVNTPDSSRYWLASSYESRIEAGLEPENVDKEFLRLWFRDNCDPYKDEVLPKAPKDLVCELSRRYVLLYEMITWKEFEFHHGDDGDGGGGEMKIARAIWSCKP